MELPKVKGRLFVLILASTGDFRQNQVLEPQLGNEPARAAMKVCPDHDQLEAVKREVKAIMGKLSVVAGFNPMLAFPVIETADNRFTVAKIRLRLEWLFKCAGKDDDVIVWYTGPSDQYTGDWLFSTSGPQSKLASSVRRFTDVLPSLGGRGGRHHPYEKFTRSNLLELYRQHFFGFHLVVVADCGFSSSWAIDSVQKPFEILPRALGKLDWPAHRLVTLIATCSRSEFSHSSAYAESNIHLAVDEAGFSVSAKHDICAHFSIEPVRIKQKSKWKEVQHPSSIHLGVDFEPGRPPAHVMNCLIGAISALDHPYVLLDGTISESEHPSEYYRRLLEASCGLHDPRHRRIIKDSWNPGSCDPRVLAAPPPPNGHHQQVDEEDDAYICLSHLV